MTKVREFPEQYWHCLVEVEGKSKKPKADTAIENDWTFEQLERQLLRPWHEGKQFVIAGRVFRSREELTKIKVTHTEQPLSTFRTAEEQKADRAARNGILVFRTDGKLAAVNAGTDHTHALLFEALPAMASASAASTVTKAVERGSDTIEQKARAVLFLDVVGWSKLKVPQIRTFIEKALPALAKLVRPEDRLMLNTWGDAIVIAFDDAVQCAELALELCAFFRKAKASDGVASGMAARVGLHFGEVFWAVNPLTGRQDIFGPAVHTAARLEPKVHAGHVFCTKDFADRLAEMEDEGPRAHPLGELEFAKEHGRQQVYVVTWRNDPPPPIQLLSASPSPRVDKVPVVQSTHAPTLDADCIQFSVVSAYARRRSKEPLAKWDLVVKVSGCNPHVVDVDLEQHPGDDITVGYDLLGLPGADIIYARRSNDEVLVPVEVGSLRIPAGSIKEFTLKVPIVDYAIVRLVTAVGRTEEAARLGLASVGAAGRVTLVFGFTARSGDVTSQTEHPALWAPVHVEW